MRVAASILASPDFAVLVGRRAKTIRRIVRLVARSSGTPSPGSANQNRSETSCQGIGPAASTTNTGWCIEQMTKKSRSSRRGATRLDGRAGGGREVDGISTRYHLPYGIEHQGSQVDRLATARPGCGPTRRTPSVALSTRNWRCCSRIRQPRGPATRLMRTEVWPLLSDRTPITKHEREEILGYDPETGV